MVSASIAAKTSSSTNKVPKMWPPEEGGGGAGKSEGDADEVMAQLAPFTDIIARKNTSYGNLPPLFSIVPPVLYFIIRDSPRSAYNSQMCTPDVAQHPRSLYPERITSSPFLEEQREIRHVSCPSFRVLQHEHHGKPRKDRGRQVLEKAPRHQVPHKNASQMPFSQHPDREAHKKKRRANAKKKEKKTVRGGGAFMFRFVMFCFLSSGLIGRLRRIYETDGLSATSAVGDSLLAARQP